MKIQKTDSGCYFVEPVCSDEEKLMEAISIAVKFLMRVITQKMSLMNLLPIANRIQGMNQIRLDIKTLLRT